MIGIDEPVELLAVPADNELCAGIERLDDAGQRPDRHAAEVAVLDPRDDGARDAGPISQVGLAPAAPMSQVGDRSRKVRSHVPMITDGRLPSGYRGRMLWPVTYDELLALARRLEGRTIETVTGRRFTVGTYLDSPVFTPASSGIGQSDGRKAAERFLDRYNRSGSLRPGDYADVTRNASYFIGMILASNE